MKIPAIPLRAALMGLSLGIGFTLPAKAAHHEHAMEEKSAAASGFEGVTELIADIGPLGDSNVEGSVVFKQVAGGVEVTAKIGGFEPGTEHGFHIHELGNISAPDGTSAGGHYNPEGHDHALPDTDTRHAGDLGNLKADDDGNATLTVTVDNITLAGAKNPIIGRSVVVHADKDDGGQPTGNAGGRIGIGVIGISKVSSTAEMKPTTTANPPPTEPGHAGTHTEVTEENTATPGDPDGVVAPAPPVEE